MLRIHEVLLGMERNIFETSSIILFISLNVGSSASSRKNIFGTWWESEHAVDGFQFFTVKYVSCIQTSTHVFKRKYRKC